MYRLGGLLAPGPCADRRQAPAASTSATSYAPGSSPAPRPAAATQRLRCSTSPRRRLSFVATPLRGRPGPPRPAAAQGDAPGSQPGGGPSGLLLSAALLALWGGLMYYVLAVSPNQTPYRDSYFVEKLVGLGVDDGVAINAVFSQVWNMLGLFPATYAALLIPAGRSANKVPVWPFVTLSFGLGMYAILPYFALWQAPADADAEPLPPAKDSLQGWRSAGLRLTESLVFGALITAGAAYSLYNIAAAPPDAWVEYFRLLRESRLVHASSLDLCLFTALSPFWLYNDASRRGWAGKDFAPLLGLLPLLGAAIYLCLRPKAE